MNGRSFAKDMRARILIVALVQTVALAAIIADRAVTLATGRELVVKTVPVDPRDLFRGDYVSLDYGMSRIETGRLGGERAFSAGERVFVTLRPAKDEWVPAAVSHRAPRARDLGDDGRLLSATVAYVYEAPERPAAGNVPACPAPCTTLTLKYGIESYFVPEGAGRALEEERNAKRLSVVLAVRGDGRAAIKALKLGDKILAREGLF